MENNQTKFSSVFTSSWFKIILVIVGIILIAAGLYKIFWMPSGKVSKAFINKFNEIHVTIGDMGSDMKAAGEIMMGISAKENSKDYKGAVQDLSTGLDKLADLETKANNLTAKAAEFKNMVNAVKDPAVKESGLKFIDLVEQKAAINLKIADDTKQMLELAKKYFESLAASKEVALPTAQLTALSQKSQVELKTADEISAKFEAADQELAKIAGFQLKSVKK